MNKKNASEATKELIQELCALTDNGVSMGREKFHNLCEQQKFIDFIWENYREKVRFHHFNKASPLFELDVMEYINDALDRHGNVVVMEDFSLKNNALLLGVSICMLVLEELDETR